MTTIAAKTILASTSQHLPTIHSLQLRYPMIIHSETLTHRIISADPQTVFEVAYTDGLMYDENLSRNASSSRAIPAEKLLADVERDPFVPIYWGQNQKGMQAREELTGQQRTDAISAWMKGLEHAITTARALIKANAHKQVVNRVLGPYAHINVLVTATSWHNFLELRDHDDAEPHIRLLAQQVRGCLMDVEQGRAPSQNLVHGQWHLPYVSPRDLCEIEDYCASLELDPIWLARRVSAARSARLSYLTFEGKASTFKEDNKLCEMLMGGRPFHASPFEHQATPAKVWIEKNGGEVHFDHGDISLMRNFQGWKQNRAILEVEFARAACLV